MGNRYQLLEADSSSLKHALKAARDIGEYRRLQAVHLRVSLELSVEDISRATGFSSEYIRHIHSTYRRGGLTALLSKIKGGRYHSHLSEDEERAFIAPFLKRAAQGGILEIGVVHRSLEERLGRALNRQVTYNILHRHGWRKIAPRPKHPGTEEAAQAAFKKTGHGLSKKHGKKPKAKS